MAVWPFPPAGKAFARTRTGHSRASRTAASTFRVGAAWNPIWLPRDAGIAFLAAGRGPGKLFVMRPNGTDVHRLALPKTGQFMWVDRPLPPSC